MSEKMPTRRINNPRLCPGLCRGNFPILAG